MKLLELLNKVVMAFTGLVLAFMTVLVLLQILFRYVLGAPFPEGQELAVYAMVYVVMFGSTIAVYRKSHIAVTFLVEKFPPPVKFAMRLVAYAAMAVFFILLIKYGWTLSMRSMRQLSPSTGIPVGYIVASIPVSAAISVVYICRLIYAEVRNFLLSRKGGAEY